MNPQKQELLEKLKGANNILVTVSANPSVDQLAACIGMTLLLNKLKKHATAVFSGAVPSTIEFLKPEETIEKNTDSLRDFIISLDKSKADKLRYKVEDQVVRIFITPYKTSISQADLEFGQGDFNVDVVVCLGVSKQEDLDQAITAHGRILHDAAVISINTQAGSELGGISWIEPSASSLSELVSGVADVLGKDLLDAQIATALLTGIVAETDRFSNEKTSPETMRLSAELMSAGANQQLVATQLETPPEPPEPSTSDDDVSDDNNGDDSTPAGTGNQDGTLEISHPQPSQDNPDATENIELPEPQEETTEPGATADVSASDDDGLDDILGSLEPKPAVSSESPMPASEPSKAVETSAPDQSPPPTSRIMLQPPSLGGTLTANTIPEEESLADPFGKTDVNESPMLDHVASSPPPAEPPVVPTPPASDSDGQIHIDANGNLKTDTTASSAPATQPAAGNTGTLSDLETAIKSPHVDAETNSEPASAVSVTPAEPAQGVNAARDAVMSAINSAPPTGPLPPTESSGATGYLDVQDLEAANNAVTSPDLTEASASVPTPGSGSLPLPTPAPEPPTSSSSPTQDDNTPPPVPPPLPFNDLSKFSAPPSQ